MEGKTARACDACMRRRARWFCAANDAFLCQSCDSSVDLANQLARRHERVRLRTCATSSSFSLSSSVQSPTKKTPGDVTETPVWYEGFTKKARTPRSLLGKSLQSKKAVNVFVNDDFGLDLNSNFNLNDPLVPEIGSEDGSFSFSSVDENEENLNCRVPVFDFPDMEIEVKDNNNSFGFFQDSDKIDGGDLEEGQMNDGLNGFLPLDIDLAEFSMDVESLLGEESGVDVRESGVFEFKEDENIEVNIDLALKSVKNEEGVSELEEDFRWNLDYGSSVLGRKREEVEIKGKIKNDGLRSDDNNGEGEELVNEKAKKKSVFLRLDYAAVMTAWDSQCSPWTTGFRPEFSPCDCWPDCLLQGFMCPIHVLNGSEEATAVGSVLHQQRRGGGGGGSDSEREARVLRYKEKRRTRLFAKKIRYEVRKLNAEKRPRIKGRFVKRTSLLAAAS